MRQIGTIPRDVDPRPLVDHLLAAGISTRVDTRPDGALVWVHNEDHLAVARQALDEYLKDPGASRYLDAERAARERRLEAERKDREFRKNFRDMSGSWDQPNLRRRPVTTGLIAISTAVFLLRMSFPQWRVYDLLAFTTFAYDQFGFRHPLGIANILHGEVWRLVTPIFLHFGWAHLIFNMWALWVVGSLIEVRRGTMILAMLVVVAAVLSDVGQYVYDLRLGHELARFGGMSGVVYALFGYVWMKGKLQPEQGMIMPPSTVQTMLLWLVLCFTGFLGPIANAAHVVGLIVGVILGLARL